MPDLTYSGAYPVTAGTARDATAFRDLVHDEDAPQESLAIINGKLDADNVGSWTVGREYQQRGSSLDAFQAARTTSLDWSWRTFGEYEMPSTGTDISATGFGTDLVDSSPFRPLPGACREFHSPWDGYVLVMWTAFWANDNGGGFGTPDPLYLSALFLTANGTYVPSQVRFVGECHLNASTSNFYQRARKWEGHALVPISKGFNALSVNIVCDRRVRLTRAWASSMVCIPMKGPA